MESNFDDLPTGIKGLLTKTFLIIYSGLMTLAAGKAQAGIIGEGGALALEPDFVARLKLLARKPQLVLKLNMTDLSASKGMMHTSHRSHSSHSSHYSSSGGGHYSHSSHSSHSSHYSSASYSSPSYSAPVYTPRSYSSPSYSYPSTSSGPRTSSRSGSRKTQRSSSTRSTAYPSLSTYEYGLSSTLYSLGDRALRLGDKGDDVRQLQALLQAAGYSVTADGDFGLGTNAAVKQYQQANELDADGVAGAQTIMLLRAE